MTEALQAGLTVEQLWQRVPGGSGSYIRELVATFAPRTDIEIRGLAARHRGSGPAPGAALPVDSSRLPRRLLYDAWNACGRPRAEQISRSTLDVVHATTWALPPTRLPLVVTVHDLAFLHDPTHFTARGNRFFARSFARTLAEAAMVIAPSQQTADDCVTHGLDRDRVRVVPHGVRVPAVDAEAVSGWRRRHGVPGPYVLWTGTREPRKNLPGLLNAHRLLRAARPELDLVLVGPAGWGDAGAEPRDGVHLLGRLSVADLHAAYAGADAFCFPSIREGFGLPVLEAMAHGVPVVTSTGTPMADLVGGPTATGPADGEQAGGLAVDPQDAAAIAAAIGAVLDARPRFAAGALARAAARSWGAAAAATLDVYRAAILAS